MEEGDRGTQKAYNIFRTESRMTPKRDGKTNCEKKQKTKKNKKKDKTRLAP